jgi:hypothetical protein
MLFDLATWHAFAKLRLHTEYTLDSFDAATTYLGRAVRKFQLTTCDYYRTTELPQEHAARGRRTAALAAQQGRGASGSGPKIKKLNLLIYKFHALGDYPNTIRRFGTTDSYSTQTVCNISVSLSRANCICPRVSLNTDVRNDASRGLGSRREIWSKALQIKKLLSASSRRSILPEKDSISRPSQMHSCDALAHPHQIIISLPSPLVVLKTSLLGLGDEKRILHSRYVKRYSTIAY